MKKHQTVTQFLLFLLTLLIFCFSLTYGAAPASPIKLYPICLNGQWGYINAKGAVVIKPQYESGNYFSEGVALIKINNQYGYINPNGSYYIKPQYDDASDFKNNYAWVGKVYNDINGNPVMTYGYINKAGKLIIDYQYTKAYHFTEGLAWAVSNGEKAPAFSLITPGGQYIFKPATGFRREASGNLKPPAGTAIAIITNVGEFSQGLAAVKANSKWGFINKNAYFTINLSFDYASDFREGLALVKKADKYGYIKPSGKFAIQPQYEDGKDFSEGLAPVKIKGKWGFIDKTGRIVIRPKYEDVDAFHEGLGWVSLKNNSYLIDKAGKTIVKLTGNNKGICRNGLIITYLNGKTPAYLSPAGKSIYRNPDIDLFTQGKTLYEYSKYNDALPYLDKAIAMNQTNPLYYFYKMLCLKALGINNDTTIDCITHASPCYEGNNKVFYYLMLADTYAIMNNQEKTIESLQLAITSAGDGDIVAQITARNKNFDRYRNDPEFNRLFL